MNYQTKRGIKAVQQLFWMLKSKVSAARPVRSLALTLAIAIGASVSLESIALAQQYVPPPDVGLPGRRRAAGTRAPSCITGEDPLIALQPENTYGVKIGIMPTWFWYKAETTPGATAEFTLNDAAGNTIYQATLALPAAEQIVSFRLPPTVALQENVQYQWYFSIVCDSPDDDGEPRPFTEGTLVSVEPMPSVIDQLVIPQINQYSPERLAANGFWYDAIAVIAHQRREPSPNFDPSAGETWWRSLLTSVNLGDLADVPLSQSDLAVITHQP